MPLIERTIKWTAPSLVPLGDDEILWVDVAKLDVRPDAPQRFRNARRAGNRGKSKRRLKTTWVKAPNFKFEASWRV
jgi:hypothetical protein